MSGVVPLAVLVDSSVWIDHFRHRPTRASLQRAQWLADEPDCIVVNSIVACGRARGMPTDTAAAVLLASLAKRPQADALRHDDWLASARIYRHCRAAGLTIRSPMDCLIAAHAMRLRLPLLSVDRDFEAIATQCPLALHDPAAH